MSQSILCYGIPPLTEDAADAALDMIHFIAAAVRGFDAIEINDVVRPLWRTHLAAWYSQIPFETRNWYANAPAMLANVAAQWQLLNPWQRAGLIQQWNFELPNMLWMLEPVLEQAHALEIPESVRDAIAGLRQAAAPAAAPPDAAVMQDQATSNQLTPNQAVQELGRQSDIAAQLASFSTRMNNLTLTQMHAMSGS